MRVQGCRDVVECGWHGQGHGVRCSQDVGHESVRLVARGWGLWRTGC